MAELWERQPGESPPAWEAWVLYRDHPPGNRSHRGVARQLRKSASLVARWSSKFEWVVRARGWDNAQDQVRVTAQQQVIAQVASQQAEEREATRENTLQEVSRLAFSTLTEAVSWDREGMNLKDSAELSPEAAASVQSVSVRYDRDGRPIQSIKLHEKMGALDRLGQHFKLWGKDENPTDAGEFFLAFLRDLKNGKIDAALRERGFLPPLEETVETEVVPVAGTQPKFAPVEASEAEEAEEKKSRFKLAEGDE